MSRVRVAATVLALAAAVLAVSATSQPHDSSRSTATTGPASTAGPWRMSLVETAARPASGSTPGGGVHAQVVTLWLDNTTDQPLAPPPPSCFRLYASGAHHDAQRDRSPGTVEPGGGGELQLSFDIPDGGDWALTLQVSCPEAGDEGVSIPVRR